MTPYIKKTLENLRKEGMGGLAIIHVRTALEGQLADLKEKVAGMRRNPEAVGDAPADYAVGSEHRSFGYNLAIEDMQQLLSN